jgi:hypothetical protein
MNSDFRDLLHCLNECKVKYLVIGGYAVSYHAEPRYTKDLDLWVEASPANSKKIHKALQKFGAPTDNLLELDFAKPGTLFVFGLEPNRIDILNRAKGATFANAWKNKVTVKLDKIAIPFISKSDLKKLKRAMGRKQDLLDLENL